MIAAVILCAGASRRLGEIKALAEVAGEPLLHRVTRLARAAGVESVVAALGPPHGAQIRAALPAGVAWAWNARPERGMLSSLQAALPALPPAAVGTLVWPVDVALVAVRTVEAVLRTDVRRLTVPTHDQRGGHPLWLPRALFEEVAALDPEHTGPAPGLRALREHHPIVRVAVDDAEVLRDLDTPMDLERARSELAQRRQS